MLALACFNPTAAGSLANPEVCLAQQPNFLQSKQISFLVRPTHPLKPNPTVGSCARSPGGGWTTTTLCRCLSLDAGPSASFARSQATATSRKRCQRYVQCRRPDSDHHDDDNDGVGDDGGEKVSVPGWGSCSYASLEPLLDDWMDSQLKKVLKTCHNMLRPFLPNPSMLRSMLSSGAV